MSTGSHYPLTIPEMYNPLRFSIEQVGDCVYLTILVGPTPEHDDIGRPFEQYNIGKAASLPRLF